MFLKTIAALVLAAVPAAADVEVHTKLSCPSETPRLHPAALNVSLENRECSDFTVRLRSGFAANTSESAAALSLHGPVYVFETVVPAGNCATLTPTVVDFSPLLAYPPVPDSLFGALSTFIVVSEWRSGSRSKTETRQCLIAVPEPSSAMQLIPCLIGLIVLAKLEARRAMARREQRR